MKGCVFQNKRGNWVSRFTYTDQNEQGRYVKRRATVNTGTGPRQTLLEIIEEFDNSVGQKITSLPTLRLLGKHYCVATAFVDGQKIVGLKGYTRAKGSCISTGIISKY